MKKAIYSMLCAAGILTLSACSDFLETDSPSKTDAAFVFSTSETARAALEGAYADWTTASPHSRVVTIPSASIRTEPMPTATAC